MLTGMLLPVAESCQRSLSWSREIFTLGVAIRLVGNCAPALSRSDESGATNTLMRPFASDETAGTFVEPSNGVHPADGVDVPKTTVAPVVPALKTATYSRLSAASIRLT